MSELISIIVPVYNVAPYLNRCIQSIVTQTYKELEIILVDDGSTDISGKLCDDWKTKDSRIKIIHKTNGGLSDARNAGLSVATGSFVVFWDSDDWTEPEILTSAMNNQQKNDSDIVVWSYQSDFEDDKRHIINNTYCYLNNIVCRKGEDNSCLAEEKMLGAVGYAWNKLYRRELIEKHSFLFEKGTSLVEDILFNSKAFCAAKIVSFVNIIGTHYIQRPRQTLGGTYYPDAFTLKCRAAESRQKLLESFGIPEDIIHLAISRQRFGGLKSTVRMIARTEKLEKDGRLKAMNELIVDERAQRVICDIQSHGSLKEHLFAFLFQHKCVRLLLWLFN